MPSCSRNLCSCGLYSWDLYSWDLYTAGGGFDKPRYGTHAPRKELRMFENVPKKELEVPLDVKKKLKRKCNFVRKDFLHIDLSHRSGTRRSVQWQSRRSVQHQGRLAEHHPIPHYPINGGIDRPRGNPGLPSCARILRGPELEFRLAVDLCRSHGLALGPTKACNHAVTTNQFLYMLE